MLHERPDESFGWRNRLDELDLPGQLPDKAVAWEKLHTRLRKKPRNPRVLWYWAAAACFLLASGTSWVMMNEKESRAKTGMKPKEVNSSTAHTPPSEPTPAVPVPSQAKEHTVGVKVENKKSSWPVYRPVTANNNPMAENAEIPADPVQEVSVNPNKTDTLTLISSIPPKKKLRVVHINHLENTVQEQTNFARTNPLPGFQANQPDLSPAFTVSRNTSDDIVKIKLSPSN